MNSCPNCQHEVVYEVDTNRVFNRNGSVVVVPNYTANKCDNCGITSTTIDQVKNNKVKPEVKVDKSSALNVFDYLGRSKSIAPEDELWVICGDYEDGEGILAWCYNEDDARTGAVIFSENPRFNGIHFHKFKIS